MEEENAQLNNESKKNELKGFDYKKYLPYLVIALAIVIALILVLGGGPKKPVKNFVQGMNKQNASKIIKSVDFVGMTAWGYYYDEKDFSKEDYDNFIEKYEETVDDMDKDDLKEAQEYLEEAIEESFDEIDEEYKTYKIKVEKFKDVEELGKDLYAVDVKISMEAKPKDKDEADEIDESEVVTFVVYKSKVIYAGGIGF